MSDDQPRASTERADAQRAGQVAVAAAVLGLLAVVGILMSVNRDAAVEASRGLSMDDEALTTASGTRVSTVEASEVEGADIEVGAAREPLAPSSAAAAHSTLPALRPLGDAGGGDAGVPRPVVIEPASARLDHPLTPEERYESNAFVLDVITVRADIVREELAAARTSGRPALIRRLERNLAALEVESGRLADQGREMERELGLHGMREVSEGGSTPVPME